MSNEERVLGRLEEFQRSSERRFNVIEKKLDALNEFKWRMTGGAVILAFVLTGLIRFFSELWTGAHG